MNHKRGRPKNRRGGCLMCKYWKVNGIGEQSRPVKERAKRDAMKRESQLLD